jgi:Fe2+ or Zn2+ uptake regulation protein
METNSHKTEYQTLYDLAELGEIATLDVGTGMTRFDPNVDHPHHHLVCRGCGSVRDLVAAFPALRIPKGADLGFEVGSPEIVFRGLCPECRAPSRSRRAPARVKPWPRPDPHHRLSVPAPRPRKPPRPAPQ